MNSPPNSSQRKCPSHSPIKINSPPNSSRRKCLKSQTRETVSKVYHYLNKEAKEILELVKDPLYSASPVLISKLTDHLSCVRNRTAKATGVSERTVTRILAEAKESGSYKSPYKDRKKRAIKLELEYKDCKKPDIKLELEN